MKVLNGKTAAITGAASGIGRMLSVRLAEEGCRLALADIDETGLRETASLLDGSTPVSLHVTDVARKPEVDRFAAEAADRHGGVDLIINNAGVASMNHSLLMPAETARRLLLVNTLGTFLASRECAKVMQRAKYGRIVNFSSVAVPLRLEGEAMYAAAKAANEEFTRVFAREVAGFGITCNAIGPSPIPTDLIRNVPRDRIDALVGRLAIKRLGSKEDLWPVVSFLTSAEAGYITGQVIYLGGVG